MHWKAWMGVLQAGCKCVGVAEDDICSLVILINAYTLTQAY